MIEQFIDRLCKLIKMIMVVFLAIMVVLVFGNVVLRYGFNSGLAVSDELSRWLFVWITFLGAVVAMKEGTHLGTDTLISRLSLRGQKICFVIANLLMLFCCALLAKGTWLIVAMNINTRSPVMELSEAFFYGCGIFAAVVGGAVLVYKMWRMATGQLKDAELIGVRESEEDTLDIPTAQR
ncbi:TRAP transporter small permease [Limnohabitans sp. 15K]|uniref:TRAP transporter small permease n=1 Tax=Limnohabitans sp. 15K TaxID=1100706 RepID=UPI0018ED2CD1|nr:TRAP transporter small permease [Limnohabitans sp. 15K]